MLFQKKRSTFLNSFYEGSITLIKTSKENYRLMFLMNLDAKILKKIVAN